MYYCDIYDIVQLNINLLLYSRYFHLQFQLRTVSQSQTK